MGDFERLVEAVAATGRAMGLAPPARPWLPPLPEALRLDDLPPAPGRAPATAAPIGLVDEPGRQAQWTLTHDLAADGHLLVHGAARSGKSTLLRTLAVALARAHSPSALWIYGLDLSSGALRSLEREVSPELDRRETVKLPETTAMSVIVIIDRDGAGRMSWGSPHGPAAMKPARDAVPFNLYRVSSPGRAQVLSSVRLTPEGRRQLASQTSRWEQVVRAIGLILSPAGNKQGTEQ